MRELVDRRTLFSKKYELGKNRWRLELSQKPVHYIENGQLVDIDMTPVSAEFMGWERERYEKNNFKVRLKDKDGSDLTEMAVPDGQGGEYWLTLKNAHPKIPRVEVSDIKVVRDFVFESKDKITNPRETLLLDPRLKAEISGREIVIYWEALGVMSETIKVAVFKILAPSIKAGEESSSEVSFQITPFDKYILIEKIITQAGLDWMAGKFAEGIKEVRVDATLVLQPGPTAGYDNARMRYNDSDHTYDDYNYGATTICYPYYINAWPQQSYMQPLFKFDLSLIPPGSIINTATLTFVRQGSYTTAGNTLTIHKQRVLRDWGEGTKDGTTASAGESSWNCYSSPNTWTTGGAQGIGTDVDSEVDATEDIDITTATDNLNIVNTIQDIIDAGFNYGFKIFGTAAGTITIGKNWYSSDYATAASRPKLTIDFTLPAGMQELVLQPDTTAGYDMLQMCSANPSNNYGADPGSNAGNWLGKWDGVYYGRHLIKFDLSSIPPGSTIFSAYETLWPWYVAYSGFTAVYANRVLRDWGEGIHIHAPATDGESSWNHYAYPNVWTTAGAADEGTDISATVDVTSVDRNDNPMTVNVTNTVQEIIDAGVNYGWRLKTDEGIGSGAYITGYYASEYSPWNPALVPKLTVYYYPPAGGKKMLDGMENYPLMESVLL